MAMRGFPGDLRPGRAILMGNDESHPWERRRLEGTQPPDHPTSAFVIPGRSDLPYINDQTIPEGIDYQFVQAAVVTPERYTYQIVREPEPVGGRWPTPRGPVNGKAVDKPLPRAGLTPGCPGRRCHSRR
jgi:hypothetical protein